MRHGIFLAAFTGSWLLASSAMPARAQIPSVQSPAVPVLQTPAPTPSSGQSPAVDCRAASELAEQSAGLPPGLLLAIGKIETGRSNPATGQIEPFPWATNQGGSGHYFSSAQEAIAWTSANLSRGLNSIDVGCFQINLMYHPDAFATLEEAFDPLANALYAARFLVGLYRRAGGWPLAVAQYHSADLALGMPYGDKVYSAWNGTWPSGNILNSNGQGAGLAAAGAIPGGGARTVVAARPASAGDPYVMRMSDQAFGIKVFVPSWASEQQPAPPAMLRTTSIRPTRPTTGVVPMVVSTTSTDSGGHGGSRLPRVYRP